jgi:hypothetical protein
VSRQHWQPARVDLHQSQVLRAIAILADRIDRAPFDHVNRWQHTRRQALGTRHGVPDQEPADDMTMLSVAV